MNEGPGTAELKWNVWFMRELMKKGSNGNELELMLNVGDVNAANLTCGSLTHEVGNKLFVGY